MKAKHIYINLRRLFLLYIPHGSDESIAGFWLNELYSPLYIPHGSDESLSFGRKSCEWISFISHMVQMKENAAAWRVESRRTLYPTWFR